MPGLALHKPLPIAHVNSAPTELKRRTLAALDFISSTLVRYFGVTDWVPSNRAKSHGRGAASV